jgi:hypothetical protein
VARSITQCRWYTDDGRCLGHPVPGTPELRERHLALSDDWINYEARVIAQGMRLAIERQVRQESAAARDGRKPMRTQRSSRPLSIEEQRLVDSLTGASTARPADRWPLAD